MTVGALFYVLRQLEVWLHQHIFKVGWLVTKQYQTTTVLYYAFFLPGIILNQAVFWLSAGLLNVSAERTISWPEKQEIGELKLDFIRLSKNVSSVRFAIISTFPLLVGMLAIWHIANNVLHMPSIWSDLNQVKYSLDETIGRLTSAPDFWIWIYLALTISNTMMPNFANLRGWRIILGAIGITVATLYVLGAGDQIIMQNLRGPVTNALNALSAIFAVIIVVDLFMVGTLGTIEAIIERITGDSATFENGKMVTMRRSELLERRRRALAPRARQRTAPAREVPIGPPSIYKMNLPIPSTPGKEATTPETTIVISEEPKSASVGIPNSSPAIISGNVTTKLPAPSLTSEKPANSPTLGNNLAPNSSSPYRTNASAVNSLKSPTQTSVPSPKSPNTGIIPSANQPPTNKTELSQVDDDESDEDVTYEDFEDPA